MDEPTAEGGAEAAAPAAPAPRRSKKLLFIGLGLVVALGGGGAWLLLGGTNTEAKTEKEPSLEERGLITFEPFLVNLADEGGNRFLKATVQLVVPSAEMAKHMQETPVVVSHLRSAILELLTQQSAPALVTPEGKEALKAAIKTRVAQHLSHDQKVIDVLFAEFVVQF